MAIQQQNVEQKEEPWKLIYQNIRCLVSENSKMKIDYMKEFAKTNKVLIFNFTETWLDENIVEDAKIDGFKEYRSDRVGIRQGGTIVYTHENLECKVLAKMNIGKCEMIAIEIIPLNTINIVIYRPPKTIGEEFNQILNKMEDIFRNMSKPEPTIILTGDFNFPFINWKLNKYNGCTSKIINTINATNDENLQFERLSKIANQYNLVQAINGPTREENGKASTLDLIYTNDISLFTEIQIHPSNMSDHHLVEICTSYDCNLKRKTCSEKNDSGMRSYNLHSKEIKWKEINEKIGKISYENQEINNTISLIEDLLNNLNVICEEEAPKRKENGMKDKIRIPAERKKLLGRMKMLKRGRRKAMSNNKKEELSEKIIMVENELIQLRKMEKLKEESKVIRNIKENPKALYSYVNRESKRKVEIGPFKVDNKYIYEGKDICRILVEQYKSQFNSNTMNINEEEISILLDDFNEDDLVDIDIKEKDIIDAIDDLEENSSAGPDEVPAIFLKKTKNSIAKPLKYILRKSLDDGKIPDIFKLAHITPIHKGGAKTMPEQYRPVSLTSHIMKIFERVIKKNILVHLIINNLIKEKQHGFVPGRSTQSQLLAHYKDIYEAFEEGLRVDTVFLDFSKAFDKVDHNILMRKVINHKIKGKVGHWIKEFLTDRKFKVIANGTISDSEDVLSGVPQGTVLAAILFIIMISDIDENVKACIVRCFADDTRVSKKIRDEEDKSKMQEDLDSIYKWAEDNIMKFNDNKFEQLNYGTLNKEEIESYKNPSNNDISKSDIVKDLGVITNSNLTFKEHIDSIITASKITSGMIFRTFITREAEVMLCLFKTYIRSRLEYCCSIWSPVLQGEINEIERVQKSFTSKIEGLEGLDYHQRLVKLGLYSLERRRERYLIIYAWQMIEGIKENILELKTKKIGRSRRMWSPVIPWSHNGIKIKHSIRTKIHNSTAKKMERLFNAIPAEIRNISEKSVETFKNHLDKWLRSLPDTPKIDDYGSRVVAESNSIINQAVTQRVR